MMAATNGWTRLRRLLKSEKQPAAVPRGWIGVDLDGTLAEHHGWKGPEIIGAPVPAMLERVKGWLDEGIEVRIFTARISRPAERGIATRAIADWCERNGLPRLPVTNAKDFRMIELWDDRAVRVETNVGRRTDERVQRRRRHRAGKARPSSASVPDARLQSSTYMTKQNFRDNAPTPP